MTALIIICAIILIFIILVNFKIRAEFKFYNGVPDLKVKYMFFTVFPFRKKDKKPEKKAKKEKKNKRSAAKDEKKPLKSTVNEENIPEDTSADDMTDINDESSTEKTAGKNGKNKDVKPKKSLSEKIDYLTGLIDKIKVIWGSSKKGLKKLFLHIYIEGLVIDFRIAGDDAYKTAMTYGSVCAAVYNILNIIRALFTVKIKTVDIICDFNAQKPIFDGEVKVTIKPATILSSAFMILFGILKNLNVLLGKNNNVKNQPGSKKAVTV